MDTNYQYSSEEDTEESEETINNAIIEQLRELTAVVPDTSTIDSDKEDFTEEVTIDEQVNHIGSPLRAHANLQPEFL